MSPVACSKCQAPLPLDSFLAGGDFRDCPKCSSSLRLEVFPALFRAHAAGSAGEAVFSDAEASCFYHPTKRAAVACGNCGRFLCALCDLEIGGEHLCPPCLETSQKAGQKLKREHPLHDNIALALAILPIITVWLPLFTAPAVVYYVIRHWNSPREALMPRSRFRLILALVIALLELAGIAILIISLARS